MPSPFEIINILMSKDCPPWDEKNVELVKDYNIFMMNRILSSEPTFLPFINELNKYSKLTKEQHYNFLRAALPKVKMFINYKGVKKQVLTEEKEALYNYYQFGTKDLELALDILSDEQITQIKNKFNYGVTKK